jgi:hypothetical protein
MLRRFDNGFMQPPAPQPAVDEALLGRVLAWCHAGALPRMTTPLVAASIAAQAGLDNVACALDGSHALARLKRWQGLAWRLQIVLQDHLPGRSLRREDPWDCGWWRAGPPAAAAAFRPRRATLLMLREADREQAEELMATLQTHSRAYIKPLRVLVVSATALRGLPRL